MYLTIKDIEINVLAVSNILRIDLFNKKTMVYDTINIFINYSVLYFKT